MPPYERLEDGSWRPYGEREGGRPSEAMETLMTWAASEAERLGKSTLRARWTEDGPEVMDH
jgi:hypothetical protein